MKKTYWVLAALAFTTSLMGLTIPAQAQSPAGVHVLLPGDGASYVDSNDLVGTLTSRGITCSWNVGANSATITFTGTYATEWMSPNFNVYWFNSPDNLPFAVHVVSSNGSAYDFEAPFNTGSWDTSLNQNDLTGNFDFGYHFPACSRFDINVNPDVEGAPYDMTITMAWGEGTADYAATMSSVKALYR